jgi:fumarylacetoacetase
VAELNETQDPRRRSWVETANARDTDFPVQNLPFGVFRRPGGAPQGGVAIGDQILDLAAGLSEGLFEGDVASAAQAAAGAGLNPLMALESGAVSALRRRLSDLLRSGGPDEARVKPLADRLLVSMADATMELPAAIGDYTDFSCSTHHMMRMGGGTVRPVFLHLPVGYHGRASSLRVSGAEVVRPLGQVAGKDGQAVFGPEPQLDFELEFAAFVGRGNALGRPIPIGEAEDHIFGYCLLNDWSARAIQFFEMALGPFLGKSFLTTISPWVVTHEAMAPFHTTAFVRPEADPPIPAYLRSEADRRAGGLDVRLEALLSTEAMRRRGDPPQRIVATNFRYIYWTLAQMLAHHASGGCDMNPGDLFASGTVSGPEDEAKACLMEANERGTRALALPGGESRLWLEDGDEVQIRGRAEREGFVPIGFGPCDGRVAAAEAKA